MNTPSPAPSVKQPVRCWCGNARLEEFSPDYWRCPECETLVLREMRGEEISRVTDDEHDFYGKGYYLHHVQEDYGLPDLETRSRADLPERCLHWLRTMLKFVPGPGARTLELGCGHGGFVAMQRWAGLDATGLELSPWLVGKAREWFGVPVLEGRLEDQDLPAGSYDAVALMDVLEHLPDPRLTISRAVSLLRSPGSFLLIQTPCYPAGASYEELRAEDHPFLVQLKPLEHLYLFSERSVARLCAEVGVGQVRFEPAIFAHYDLFAVASAGPLRERPLSERTELLLSSAPPARWTLALLDLAEVRDELSTRLAAADADLSAVRQLAGKQDAEITRLQAVAGELWPKVDAAENARNLAVAQHSDLQRQFQRIEADNAARLEVIQSQGAELGELRSKLVLTGSEATGLRGHLERSETDRTERLEVIEAQGRELGELRSKLALAMGELTELYGHFGRSEDDRAARLEMINNQGAMIDKLHSQLHAHESERARLTADLRGEREALAALQARLAATETDRAKLAVDVDEVRSAHGALQSQLAEAAGQREQLSTELGRLRTTHAAVAGDLEASRERQGTLERHWTGRLLKRLRLWPLR